VALYANASTVMIWRRWAVIIVVLTSTAACRGDDASDVRNREPVLPGATSEAPRPATPIATEQPGYIASPQPSPGRAAPDSASDPLQFRHTRVFADAQTGRFVVRADVVNTESAFLNDAGVGWQILDGTGQTLDRGDTVIATLAPGETTSLELMGSAIHSDGWSTIEFAFNGSTD